MATLSDIVGIFYSHEALIDYAEALEDEARTVGVDTDEGHDFLEEALHARARAVQLETE